MQINLLPKAMLACLLFTCIITSAQQMEIILWPNGALGSEGKTGKEKVRVVEGDQVVTNIHHPSITLYLPAKEKATGAAVIIAPGGGHRELWITHEGYNEAKWLSDRGIDAYVLKYRLAIPSFPCPNIRNTPTFVPSSFVF